MDRGVFQGTVHRVQRVRHNWATSLFFKNFPQFVAIQTVKDFSKVNEAEVDFFLILFFYNPTDVWQVDF